LVSSSSRSSYHAMNSFVVITSTILPTIYTKVNMSHSAFLFAEDWVTEPILVSLFLLDKAVRVQAVNEI
jgi:hypothetical protein